MPVFEQHLQQCTPIAKPCIMQPAGTRFQVSGNGAIKAQTGDIEKIPFMCFPIFGIDKFSCIIRHTIAGTKIAWNSVQATM